jgi:hypothetical protein
MRIHLSLGVERNNQEEINPIDDRESEVRSASSQTTEVLYESGVTVALCDVPVLTN